MARIFRIDPELIHSNRRYLIHALAERSRLPRPSLEKFLDLHTTDPPPNAPTISAEIGVSEVTVSKLRKKLRRAIDALNAPSPDPNPTPATSDPTQLPDDLTPEEMVRIANKRIRELSESGGSDAALQKWFDFKAKFQNMRAETPDITVDPEKLLGPDGLIAMNQELLSRLRKLVRHRHEIPDFWEGLLALIDDAKQEDLKRGQG